MKRDRVILLGGLAVALWVAHSYMQDRATGQSKVNPNAPKNNPEGATTFGFSAQPYLWAGGNAVR